MDDKIFKQAEDNYPIGTMYLSADDNYKQLIQGPLIKDKNFTNMSMITDGYGGFVYYKGTWADIIDRNGNIIDSNKLSELKEARRIIYEED